MKKRKGEKISFSQFSQIFNCGAYAAYNASVAVFRCTPVHCYAPALPPKRISLAYLVCLVSGT